MNIACCSECGRPLPADVYATIASLKLSPDQEAILLTLADHVGEWVHNDMIVDTLYARADRVPDHPRKVISTQLAHAKARWSAAGLRIESRWAGRSVKGSWRRLVVDQPAIRPKPS